MELAKRMREQWNRRAKVDALHFVLNRKAIGEWNDADFYETGETDARRFVDTFCKAHRISTKRRVCLEIGCGAGRVTHALAARFKQVIGLDVSDDMLSVATTNVIAENVAFVRGNGINLEGVDTASVGFVFSTMVFQHIPDVEVQYELLRDIARVLRPKGWFFIHLYADQAGYTRKKAAWEKRAASGDLQGWSDAALPEIQNDNYQTSMCTAVDDATVRAILNEVGLSLKYEEEPNTSKWIIGGQKKK